MSDYDIYIFDCDGVILDSNRLKIDAMEEVLYALSFNPLAIKNCITYFRENFGKSRFHHVDYFITNHFNLPKDDVDNVRLSILSSFSMKCRELYLEANLTPGFVNFIDSLNGKKYIASGSEQNELRMVFKDRGLDKYFSEIFGSPVSKQENVKKILELEQNKNALMFGDAISDFESAKKNEIDFIAYLPFSNVKSSLTKIANKEGFSLIESWEGLE